jgi:hypothetical protein
MLLKVFCWSYLVIALCIYVFFIRDIEWHFKMANLLLFNVVLSFFISLGILFLWQ